MLHTLFILFPNVIEGYVVRLQIGVHCIYIKICVVFTRTCIAASSTTVKLLIVSTLNSCGEFVSFGIPTYLVECVKDIYQNQTADIETTVGRTGPLSVQSGVRHGCPLSPLLSMRIYYEIEICPGEMGRWH